MRIRALKLKGLRLLGSRHDRLRFHRSTLRSGFRIAEHEPVPMLLAASAMALGEHDLGINTNYTLAGQIITETPWHNVPLLPGLVMH